MSATLDRIDIRIALAEQAAVVEQAIDTLLPLPDGHERRLVESMRYATLGGGKRMRGFLVMEVAGLFGVATACAARVAASVEMLHAYSLVHDDLPAMDDDDVRRGQPSTHKRFDEFECPTCDAYNPHTDFGNGDEVLCAYCGLAFEVEVSDEAKLKLREA